MHVSCEARAGAGGQGAGGQRRGKGGEGHHMQRERAPFALGKVGMALGELDMALGWQWERLPPGEGGWEAAA